MVCCGKKKAFELTEEERADLQSIERRVKLDDRPWSGKWCLRFEMLVIAYFVIMAIVMGATGAPKYDTNSDKEIEGVNSMYEDDAMKCCDKAAVPPPGAESIYPTGLWMMSEMCYEMAENNQWKPPAASTTGTSTTGTSTTGTTRRRLAKKKHTPKPKSIFEGFSEHPGIPIGVIAMIMFLCLGFLKLMEKFAKQVLFGAFLAEGVFMLYLGVGGKDVSPIMLIFAALLGLYVFFMRKKIAKAGDCISVAATALLSMPSLMATVYMWMLASVVLVALLILVVIASGNQNQVGEGSEKTPDGQFKYTTCEWESKGAFGFITFTLVCIWKWMWAYLVMTQVYFVAGCVAQFNFDRSLVTKTMPLTLIKLAFTKSAGTVGKSALILQFINWVKKNSKVSCKNLCCLCVKWPVVALACLLRCCCLTCLEMMNKFALIFHVITGDEFWLSAKRCYRLMKSAGLDALVMETSAMNAFILIGYGLSLGVGVFTWWWAGVEYGKDVLGNEDMWGEEDEYMNGWSTLMLVIMAILLLVPTAAIFLTVIIAMAVGSEITRCWIPWFCGLFCGGVCAQFFWQTVNALLIASNSTFCCIAIDKVKNVAVPADKDNALYAMAQADIVAASELAKVEPAKADAGAATAVAAQPVANVPAAVPDAAPAEP